MRIRAEEVGRMLALLTLASGIACVGANGVPDIPGAGGSMSPAQGGAGGTSSGAGAHGGSSGAAGAGGSVTGIAGATGSGVGGASGGAGVVDPTKYLPWTDGFEDMAFVTQFWRTADTNGTWSVVTDGSKVYQAVAGSTETISVTGYVNWVDQVVEVKVKLTATSSDSWAVDVLPRLSDLRNYYQLTLSASSLALHVRVNNARTELVTKYKVPTPLTIGVWHTLKFAIKNGTGGALITAYLDGIMALTVTDPAALHNGGVGLGALDATVEFDDLSVNLLP